MKFKRGMIEDVLVRDVRKFVDRNISNSSTDFFTG